MKLYEYNQAINDLIDEETGEIIDEEKFNELMLGKEEKIEGLLLWSKELTAEAKAIKEEEKNLADRRKALENKAENIKNFVQYQLEGQKFSTSKVAVTYRKSQAVEITDLSLIPEIYLRHKEPEADKTALKEILKTGEIIDGCELVDRISMTVK